MDANKVAMHIAAMLDTDEYNRGQIEALETKATNAASLLAAVAAAMIRTGAMSIEEVDGAIMVWPGLEDRLTKDKA